VNSDLTPALVAAGSGSAMIAGIWWHEHRQAEAMRRSRVRLGLRFPIGLEPSQALAALDGLAGLPYTSELVAEVACGENSIAHFLWVPGSVRTSVQSTMTGVIPSLRITEAPPSPDEAVTLALRLFIPTPSVLSAENAVAASRALLSGMVGLRSGEQLIIRWALRPGSARRWQEPENPSERERETAKKWRGKTSLPGFSASGLVLIRAPKMARARQLASHIENSLRSRRQVGGVRVTRERGNRTLASMPRTTRSSGWLSTPELLALTGWPLGADMAVPGVEVGAARALPVPSGVPREGRRLFIGHDGSGAERPVALSAEAARHHMAVVGPTGAGKSVLLAKGVLSDIASGSVGGVVIDPKGPDLINTILAHVRPEDAPRIAVLDPGDTKERPIPGVALFSGGDPDLRAEALTGALRSIFAEVWSVRSDYYLRLAIRALSSTPGATLANIGDLFFNTAYRRAAVARLSDSFQIAAWEHYEQQLSSAAKAEHVQAPMARVMALLNMPRVRAVLASPAPTVDIPQLLAEKKWLLISLSPGQLGEGPAMFVASALAYLVWSSIEARSALAPEARSPVSLVVDELATLTRGVPFSFELLAERARGLGASITVSLQTVGRVPEPTRSSLLGNVATLITFRAAAEEAARLSRELPGLTAQDVMSLGRFEVAARVGVGVGSAVTVVTGRTEPLGEPTGQTEAIRDRSAAEYGAPTEPDSSARQAPPPLEDDSELGRQRRPV
jgi:hypothetical protein